MEKMQTSYFECQCESSEHTLRFVYDPDENELWTEIQLIQYKNIFQRMWTAIRYILKLQVKWGHWDCWLLKNEDCEKLKKLLNKVIEKKQSIKNEAEASEHI